MILPEKERKRTFVEITNYHYNNVKEKSGEVPLIYLVANKIDLWIKEEVSEERILQKKRKLNILEFLQKQDKELIF